MYLVISFYSIVKDIFSKSQIVYLENFILTKRKAKEKLRMHALVLSWLESLTMLRISTVKTMAFLAFKATVLLYKALLKNVWLLRLSTALLVLMLFSIAISGATTIFFLYSSFIAFSFLIVILLRPSVGIKNTHYCFEKLSYVPYYVGIVSLLFLLQNIISIQPILSTLFNYAVLLGPSSYFYMLGLSPLFVFTVLAILDSPSNLYSIIQACIRALKLILYNYPLCYIYWASMLALTLFYHWFLTLLPTSVALFVVFIGIVLLIPYSISLWTTLYIKRMHEQFDIYYKQ